MSVGLGPGLVPLESVHRQVLKMVPPDLPEMSPQLFLRKLPSRRTSCSHSHGPVKEPLAGGRAWQPHRSVLCAKVTLR